jgi:hypothetical protein
VARTQPRETAADLRGPQIILSSFNLLDLNSFEILADQRCIWVCQCGISSPDMVIPDYSSAHSAES